VENFPSNSQNPRATTEDKPTERVVPRLVEGTATRRKKPLGKRMREMFLADGDGSVMDFVFGEVLIPAMKDMVTDAVSQGFERMIYGETRSSVRRNRPSSAFGNTQHTNYNARYAPNQRHDNRPTTNRRTRAPFDDIVIPSRSEAIDVLHALNEEIGKYEVVSVRALYEMVGLEFHFTDEKFGWSDLSSAGIRRVSNGYLLDLPRAEPID